MLPNQILGGNTRSFNCSTDQTASGDVDPPEKESKSRGIHVQSPKIEKRSIENGLPGGAEDGDADGEGNADGGEGVGGDSDNGAGPRA